MIRVLSSVALLAMTFRTPMRVIGPGDAVTADFRPDRLNIEHDADGIITRVAYF